ncbi:hypothetical protein ACFQQB_02340 [Nonomuraea rubra]|uniref:hypothetical protein n=1 Tax=Nonomuraea rubra TaxID=46180 RepID=UPI0036134658
MQQRTALLGVVLLAATAIAAPAHAAPTQPAQPATKPQPAKTITLITGDKVTFRELPNKQTQLDVAAGPGREKINFVHRRSADGLSIVPVDAMPSWPRAPSTHGSSTSPGWPRSATTTPPARSSR